MITAASKSAGLASITWKAITGQNCVEAQVARKDPLDRSHMPSDPADMTDADRMAQEEKEANKHLKSFYALGTVMDTTVRSLGGLGTFWGMIQGLMGSPITGWTAVWAGMGSALTVTDASFQTRMAAVNRNMPAAIDGTFSMVQGMGVLLTAMGLGRIPSLVAVGALVGKMGYGMYRSAKAEQEKEAAKKEDEARKQAAKQQPPAQASAPAPVAAPAPPQPAPPSQPAS